MINAVGPVVGDPIELGTDPLQFDHHLGHAVLNLGVVGERAAGEADRGLRLEVLDRQIQNVLGQPVVDVRETGEGPAKDARMYRSAPAYPGETTRAM